MSYKDKLKVLCKTLDVDNPPAEDDVTVKGVSFLVGHEWQNFDKTEENRAERLFFQHVYDLDDPSDRYTEVDWNKESPGRGLAVVHFDERWTTAKADDTDMIATMKYATKMKVHWKV